MSSLMQPICNCLHSPLSHIHAQQPGKTACKRPDCLCAALSYTEGYRDDGDGIYKGSVHARVVINPQWHDYSAARPRSEYEALRRLESAARCLFTSDDNHRIDDCLLIVDTKLTDLDAVRSRRRGFWPFRRDPR